jgi:hypothetical protein
MVLIDQLFSLLVCFCAMGWLSFLTFQRTILPPSSGWVNLVQVDAEVVGKKTCCFYGKVGGILANQSYGSEKRWQGSYQANENWEFKEYLFSVPRVGDVYVCQSEAVLS